MTNMARGLAVAAGAWLATTAPACAGPTLIPSAVVVGPSLTVTGLGGLSIARDGAGGLVFTEQTLGGTGIFVSRFVNGSFAAPVQVDAALGGSSSQPVIAASNGGLLAVAFLNGGSLYETTVTSTAQAFPAPTLLANAAQNPAISADTLGKMYLGFTVADGSGSDVRAAFFDAGTWAVEPTPLNVTAADNAGTGSGRPDVVTAGDGVGIVVWGENGHIYTRRVWGTSPSVVYQQADPPSIGGWTELSADEPSIGAGGDSSYVTVGYRETVTDGQSSQTRVMSSRLIAGQYQAAVASDGLTTPGAEGADDPQVVIGEYGKGFLLSQTVSSNELFALTLGANEAPGTVVRVDSELNTKAPMAIAGTAGLYSSIIAWQEQGPGALPEIHIDFSTDGGPLGTEQLASNPLLGPTDAAAGLAASGDVAGDAAVAWVQGIAPLSSIVVAQLYQPPGSISLLGSRYLNTSQPTFAWSAARESWGPVTYTVSFDGQVVATTTATSFTPPAPLPDGSYTLQVSPKNQGGLTSSTKTRTFDIDTLAPNVQAVIDGPGVLGEPVQVRVNATDLRPGEAPAGSSGIASVTVGWGDGSTVTLGRGGAYAIAQTKAHVYTRPGLYEVTVTATDRAGNSAVVSHFVRVSPKPVIGPRRRLG